MATYENQRVNFEKIKAKYVEYLKLYMAFNNGSYAGASDFGDFYLRYQYLYRYADPQGSHKQN